MQLFKFECKFQKNGRWSNLDADTIGYFVKRDGSDIIEGYAEMQYLTSYDKIRAIKGLYIPEKKQLVFMQLSNMSILSPVAYDFPNLEKDGFWSGFDCQRGFFDEGSSDGRATVKLEEITDEPEKKELLQKVLRAYSESIVTAPAMNCDLLQCVEQLRDFLDENSRWYPKN